MTDPGSCSTTMVAARRDTHLMEGVSAREESTRLKSLRAIKNQIIGNKNKKLQFISGGVVRAVIGGMTASAASTDAILVESAVLLGSLAYNTDEGLREILGHEQGLQPLLRLVTAESSSVVHAALRALKQILEAPSTPRESLLEPATLSAITGLLSSPNPAVSETAAAVMARCCTSGHERLPLVATPAVVDVLAKLLVSDRKAAQGYAMESLARILPHDTAACAHIVGMPAACDALAALLKDRVASARLLAATCLTHATKSVTFEAKDGSTDHQAVQRAVLLVLLRLLGTPEVSGQASGVLATLLEGSETLQKAAAEGGAVRMLASLLVSEHGSAAAVKHGCLRALGCLCLNDDDSRKELITAKVLRHVVKVLENTTGAGPSSSSTASPATPAAVPSAGNLRSAAATCIMALSRSARNLRSMLLEVDVAPVLCTLLDDESADVRGAAAAAICNLVLEFLPAKEAVLRHGGLAKLVALLDAPQPPLRLHSCWALRNLLVKSEPPLRQQLTQELPWAKMRTLLNDVDGDVAEQAVCVLRNLCMDKPENISAALSWSGNDLLGLLEEKLDPCREAPAAVRAHALYTVANLLTGSEAHKEAVMASNLPALLVAHLKEPSGELLLPAVWCIINLTWPSSGPAGSSRCRRLVELGVEELLQSLQQHATLSVQERAKTALDQLKEAAAA